jgi:hypothetical protein
MIQVTHRRMSPGGTQHEHITRLSWIEVGISKIGDNSREEMVKWINDGGRAVVIAGDRQVDVLVVGATPPYLRTYADGVWTDNLLALPTF